MIRGFWGVLVGLLHLATAFNARFPSSFSATVRPVYNPLPFKADLRYASLAVLSSRQHEGSPRSNIGNTGMGRFISKPKEVGMEADVAASKGGVGPLGMGGVNALKMMKKLGAAAGLAVLSLVLLSGLPVVANAASTSLADLSVSASSSFNSIMAKLAASGFLQAFSLVFVSEIGDKTFFIAGLLAMKTSRLISFTGSMAALSVMTIISVIIGQIFHVIPSGLAGGIQIDQWVAVLAFAYFGLKTLKDSYDMPDGDMSGIEEEKAEAEKAVEDSGAPEQKTPWATILQIFSLVFAAEFGDRSFLSTIALGAAQNPISVATGAIGAHATATGIAVASGAFLSKYLSEKLIGYIGGSLFVIFAITTALGVF